MTRQIILDTETTGLDVKQGHRLIEIGCVELIDRKITNNSYHCYLNPQREVSPDALAIHGISNEFLHDKPYFSDIASEFINYVQGAELIIHNAPFDVGFINNEFKLAVQNVSPLASYCRIVDTMVMARRINPGMRNSLDALCKRYGVNNAHREYHGALLDAYLLAHVYLAMSSGQRNLFDGLTVAAPVVQQVRPDIDEQNLRVVIKASDAELLAHNAYLQELKKHSKCLWINGEDS
jgi:DNA polymerase-3 subunit epsilon